MPHTVRLAAYLCAAGLAGSLLTGFLDPTPLPAVPEGMEDAVRLGMVVGIILGIAANAFGVWLIWKAYSRRNWARIVLLVFTVVGVSLYLPHITSLWSTSAVFGIGDGFFIACEVVGAVLFFVPDSNRWFRSASRVQQEAG
jgi:hypothetical protein